MHARALCRIRTALPLATVSCATATYPGLHYPLVIRSAHVVVDDAARPLLITGQTVDDDDLRIALQADQSGFVFTFAAGDAVPGTILWDEATFART
ncbi:MAG: hypothetical protein LJF04_10230 [Gemmatimonadetes bacterium]|nr:hypothetical protein [Gemmatimonadota bacterium]